MPPITSVFGLFFSEIETQINWLNVYWKKEDSPVTKSNMLITTQEMDMKKLDIACEFILSLVVKNLKRKEEENTLSKTEGNFLR